MADAYPSKQLEQLADEAGCTAQIVQDLYQDQFETLQRDARVRAFIPVLAVKHVRDVLRRYDRLER